MSAIRATIAAGGNRIPYITGYYPPSEVSVLDLTAGKAMRRVEANPGPGDYAADEQGGVYTFSAGDDGHSVLFTPAVERPAPGEPDEHLVDEWGHRLEVVSRIDVPTSLPGRGT